MFLQAPRKLLLLASPKRPQRMTKPRTRSLRRRIRKLLLRDSSLWVKQVARPKPRAPRLGRQRKPKKRNPNKNLRPLLRK